QKRKHRPDQRLPDDPATVAFDFWPALLGGDNIYGLVHLQVSDGKRRKRRRTVKLGAFRLSLISSGWLSASLRILPSAPQVPQSEPSWRHRRARHHPGYWQCSC